MNKKLENSKEDLKIYGTTELASLKIYYSSTSANKVRVLVVRPSDEVVTDWWFIEPSNLHLIQHGSYFGILYMFVE